MGGPASGGLVAAAMERVSRADAWRLVDKFNGVEARGVMVTSSPGATKRTGAPPANEGATGCCCPCVSRVNICEIVSVTPSRVDALEAVPVKTVCVELFVVWMSGLLRSSRQW